MPTLDTNLDVHHFARKSPYRCCTAALWLAYWTTRTTAGSIGRTGCCIGGHCTGTSISSTTSEPCCWQWQPSYLFAQTCTVACLSWTRMYKCPWRHLHYSRQLRSEMQRPLLAAVICFSAVAFLLAFHPSQNRS